MTREEASKVIKDGIEDMSLDFADEEQYEALTMAIKALEQEPKTGHWIEIAQYSDGNHKIECSECESHIFDRGHANSFNVKNKYKYCPNCGCRMVEPQERSNKE